MRKKIVGMLILASLFMVGSCLVAQAISDPSLTEILDNVGFTTTSKTNSTDVTFPAGRYKIILLAEFTKYHNANVLSYYPIGTHGYNIAIDDSEGNFGYVMPTISKIFTVGSDFGLSIWVTPKYSRFPGDCNHDGEVNITDADVIRTAWTRRTGELGYNPELDFNKDGIINIKDATIIGINWLKRWTNRYFTQNSLNPDDQVHSVVYNDLENPMTYIIGFENAYGAGEGEYQDMVVSLQIEPPSPVVPEVPFGTIMTIAGMMTALAGYMGVKRYKPRLKWQ